MPCRNRIKRETWELSVGDCFQNWGNLFLENLVKFERRFWAFFIKITENVSNHGPKQVKLHIV